MSETIKCTVIGHPIGHTMSPYIHARLFGLSGIDAEYGKMDISPECLKESYAKLKTLNGFNVTIPHKQTIIPMLDKLDTSAKIYGAVNCVSINRNMATGYNTDAFGFVQALESNGISLSGKVLICGSGGAARTFAIECAGRGCDVYIASLPHLADYLKSEVRFTNLSYDQIDDDFDIIINATPVGMYPNCDASVLTKQQLRCKALFDAVYNPRETKLIKLANQLGITAVGGMSMLVWQAAKAHQYWYGASFNTDDIQALIHAAEAAVSDLFGDQK